MSLTGFLKQSRETRQLLRQHFPYPLRSVVFPPMQAPPITTNYAMVGQAFDYLLRFHMERHNPATPRQRVWIADGARLFVNDGKSTLVGEDEETQRIRAAEMSALPFLESAHAHYDRYLEDGAVTDELLGSCLNLAILDGMVRAGELRAKLGAIDPKDVQDLRNLLATVPSTPFLDSQRVTLNPAFRFPSGADCDLLIDDALIEIKTTKFSEVKEEYYQQLLGYCLCDLLRVGSFRFRRIGVYFSRHGFLWTANVSDIASEDTFSKFLPIWEDQVAQFHGQLSEAGKVIP